MKKLTKILPIALIGTIVPIMTIIPTSCKNSNENTKPITEAKWKAAFAYFDLYNNNANYKVDGEWTLKDKTIFHNEEYEGSLLFEAQGLNKHLNLTEKNSKFTPKDAWIEKTECFDTAYSKSDETYKYPIFYSTSYYYNELWQYFDIFAYTVPMYYDAFTYDKTNDEYSWTLFESDYINLKFINKFNSDNKLSKIAYTFSMDIGEEIIKSDATFSITYNGTQLSPVDRSNFPNNAYIFKELDNGSSTTITFPIPNDNFSGPGVAKFVPTEGQYNMIKLESTSSCDFESDEVELVLNGEVLTPSIDYTIDNKQIKLLNGLKVNAQCPLVMLWELDESITTEFKLILDSYE